MSNGLDCMFDMDHLISSSKHEPGMGVLTFGQRWDLLITNKALGQPHVMDYK